MSSDHATIEIQKLLEETRNGVKLPGAVIMGLVHAAVDGGLKPSEVLTWCKEDKKLELLFGAKDGDGDRYMEEKVINNGEMLMMRVKEWAAEDKLVTPPVTPRKPEVNSPPSIAETMPDGRVTRSKMQSVMSIEGAAIAMGISPAEVCAMGKGITIGTVMAIEPSDVVPATRIDYRLSAEMKTARKMGANTLEKVLKTGELSEARHYFSAVAGTAANEGLTMVSVIIMRWLYQTSEVILSEKPTDSEVKAFFDYIAKYVDRYYGLGFPMEIDYELLARGQIKHGSKNGGGASVDNSETIRAIKEETKEAKREAARVSKELADLREAVKSLKKKGPGTGKMECFICGGEHLARDCPQKPGNKGKKGKEKEGEDAGDDEEK